MGAMRGPVVGRAGVIWVIGVARGLFFGVIKISLIFGEACQFVHRWYYGDMLTPTPTYTIKFFWSPAYTLTETMVVVDTLRICGAWRMPDLVEWLVANRARATGWNMAVQLTQLLPHLTALGAVVDPVDGVVRDFMDMDRVTDAWSGYMPTGDPRLVVTKYSGSGYTTIRVTVVVAKREVVLELQIIRQADTYTLTPVPTPEPTPAPTV